MVGVSTLRLFDFSTFSVGVSAFLLVAGCGETANFGESITVAQDKRSRLDDPLTAGGAIHLPADRPFNVADAQRFSSGDAEAEASADPAGKASCRANAKSGGAAWAEFQLGQVLDHRGEKPLEATITFHVNYRYRLEGADQGATPDAAPTGSKFALKAYIQDSNKRVLKRVMLADAEPSKGPQSWTGKESPSFDVTLEAGLAYHLVLAGRAEASGATAMTQPAAPSQRSSTTEIEVASLEIEVAPKVATAMKTR